MWVAQEWRSACGLTGRGDARACAAPAGHDVEGPLAAEPTAARVQEHRLGVVPAPPARRHQRRAPSSRRASASSAVGAHPPEGDEPLLGALAVEADEPLAAGQVGEVEAAPPR